MIKATTLHFSTAFVGAASDVRTIRGTHAITHLTTFEIESAPPWTSLRRA
jgi:hypothetical protein